MEPARVEPVFSVQSEDDVFLLVKQFMWSQCLSQHPILVLPASKLLELPDGPTVSLPRNQLSKRTISEYRKTADVVSQKPWNLNRAALYLKQLCDNNESEEWLPPPVLEFIVRSRHAINMFAPRLSIVPDPELMAFAPGTPREVKVSFGLVPSRATPKFKAAAGKAKAAAKPQAAASTPVVPVPKVKAKSKAAPKPKVEAKAKVKTAAKSKVAPKPMVSKRAQVQRGADEKRQRLTTPQTKLGCSKCRYASQGCGRCVQRHEAWKQQQREQGQLDS